MPPAGKAAVSVATDDVIEYEQGSPDEMIGNPVSPLCAELERVWEKYGIVGKQSKYVNCSEEGTALPCVPLAQACPSLKRCFVAHLPPHGASCVTQRFWSFPRRNAMDASHD